MIICFNDKINNFNEKILNNYESLQSLMPKLSDVKDCMCPYCKRKNALINYGHYNRNISIYSNNQIKNYYVTIQRVQCKGCKRTHALLPNFVVPYVIMASFSIARIVSYAVKFSAYKLADETCISYQIIYNYIALVASFFANFKILNNSKEYTNCQNFNENYWLLNCVELSKYNFKLDFFEFHNWILFMQKFRNNSSPPVGIFISKSSPT